MLISYRWLCRHVDLEGITPQQVAEDLTLSTAEVEGLERFLPHLSDVVVGYVKTREKHPQADKLGLCTVDIGKPDGELLQIVCGAPNVDAGQHVAVAQVGTVLPGDIKLKKSKIRGIESQGMICSVRELGLGEDHDGIWVLSKEGEGSLPVGTAVAEALACEDWVIEIDNKSLTHRPDCWGHRGIARELAAIYKRELKALDLRWPEVGAQAALPVTVEDPACSRYMAVTLEGASNGPSPEWMQRLLLAVGQRPLSYLVDLSNFVMLDLGQPNHLFDRRQLNQDGIAVRMAKSGQSMTTLDEMERKLEGQDLLITSGGEAVALAGIMGGANSMVADDTTELVLEVASFDPTVVRRTSSRLALRTDSSARFEKHLDPTLPAMAAQHLVALLQAEQPSVKVSGPIADAGDWSDPALSLDLRCERVRAQLGVDVTDEQITDILRRLEFSVEASDSNGSKPSVLRVGVPSRRATKDVTIETDLIEEVGRIWRYANIPERHLVGELSPPAHDARRVMVRSIEDCLAGGARFHQSISYSFIEDSLVQHLGLGDQAWVSVLNPAAEGLEKIRRDVAPSLLSGLAQNLRERDDVRLFEIGKGYRPSNDGEPQEVHQLAMLWAGPKPSKKARFDAGRFLGLRGVIEQLFAACGIGAPVFARADETSLAPVWSNPARSLNIQVSKNPDQRVAGGLCELDPGVALALEAEGEVCLAWLDVDALLWADPAPSRYTPMPRFPGVKVDVALMVPEAVEAASIAEAIQRAGKNLVAKTELFDVYSGPNLSAGMKSLAFHVLLQSPTKTLSDKEAHKFLGRLEHLVGQLGGELRKSDA